MYSVVGCSIKMQGHLLLFLGRLPLAQMAVGTYVWINSEWVWKPEVGKERIETNVHKVVICNCGY